MSKAKDLLSVLEFVQGDYSYQGTTNAGDEVHYEQKDNGMYAAQLKDKEGNISATTSLTQKDIWSWMYDHGVRSVTWSDGRRGTLTPSGMSALKGKRVT